MAKPAPWQATFAPKKKASGKHTIDFAGIAPKAIGNRTGLRAARLLGILDAQSGMPFNPKGATELPRSGTVVKNGRLVQKAYMAGYGLGEAHNQLRYGHYLASWVHSHARPGVQRKKLAAQLITLRKQGNTVALTGYKRGRKIGRNQGSFKTKKGSWKKGRGGRFTGTA
jgi:hypothetical protein